MSTHLLKVLFVGQAFKECFSFVASCGNVKVSARASYSERTRIKKFLVVKQANSILFRMIARMPYDRCDAKPEEIKGTRGGL
jgi:hypothetical protein